MKYEHHSQYAPEDTQRAEAALLTVWAVLEESRDDLVLVGGLAPGPAVGRKREGHAMRRPICSRSQFSRRQTVPWIVHAATEMRTRSKSIVSNAFPEP